MYLVKGICVCGFCLIERIQPQLQFKRRITRQFEHFDAFSFFFFFHLEFSLEFANAHSEV